MLEEAHLRLPTSFPWARLLPPPGVSSVSQEEDLRAAVASFCLGFTFPLIADIDFVLAFIFFTIIIAQL